MDAYDLSVLGRRLEVRDYPAAAPGASPVILLHEGLGSAALWRDLPASMAAITGRRVVAYSRYGNGFSDVLGEARSFGYMHDEADALAELLLQLGIARAVFYGHSDGASIALIAAARRPELAAALVVEAPHVFVERETLDAIETIGRDYRTDPVLRERIGRHHANGDATFFGWYDVWLAPEFAHWNIAGGLGAVAAPVLCLQGDADPYGTLAQVDAICAGVSAGCDRLILSRCGHAPHRERPELVRDAAAAWLRAVAP